MRLVLRLLGLQHPEEILRRPPSFNCRLYGGAHQKNKELSTAARTVARRPKRINS